MYSLALPLDPKISLPHFSFSTIYSDSCYGHFPPLEITALVDVVLVVVGNAVVVVVDVEVVVIVNAVVVVVDVVVCVFAHRLSIVHVAEVSKKIAAARGYRSWDRCVRNEGVTIELGQLTTRLIYRVF